MKIIRLLSLCAAILVCGCGKSSKARYNSGYSDGYAEGYNTTLQLRATMVEGAWDDENYKRGYDEGRAEGVREALEKKNR
jgi:flagellar biosynthesis/type III secretory pathway protein FliH